MRVVKGAVVASAMAALLCFSPVSAGEQLASGSATWYCNPGISRCTKGFPAGGAYAAAGPALRAALGSSWRGHRVGVCNASRCVTVRLIDWCACGGDHVIDLYHSAFVSLTRGGGGNHVRIFGDPGSKPVATLPPTDVDLTKPVPTRDPADQVPRIFAWPFCL